MAEAMWFLTRGYEMCLDDIVNGAVFTEDHESTHLRRPARRVRHPRAPPGPRRRARPVPSA